jgi:hypothetical protein
MARGTGLTTLQLKHAAQRALYVARNARFVKDLAISLGRYDLTVINPEQLDYRLRGRIFGGLVIDHDVVGKLNAHQRETLDHLRAYIRPTETANAT